jgi:hypothetical protein
MNRDRQRLERYNESQSSYMSGRWRSRSGSGQAGCEPHFMALGPLAAM